MKQLPPEYVSRMKKLLGDEYADYEAELKNPPVKAFRVNTHKIDSSLTINKTILTVT